MMNSASCSSNIFSKAFNYVIHDSLTTKLCGNSFDESIA